MGMALLEEILSEKQWTFSVELLDFPSCRQVGCDAAACVNFSGTPFPPVIRELFFLD
jgi:hypothetical protein